MSRKFLFATFGGIALLVAGVFADRSLEDPDDEFVIPAEWDPELSPLVAFVEETRGLTFEHPVGLRFENVSSSYDDVAPDSSQFWLPEDHAHRALGLYEAEVNYYDDLSRVVGGVALGFYRSSTNEIVLAEGAERNLIHSKNLVHELTHALQHQHGLLVFESSTSDGAFTRRALLEGDANRVGREWISSLPKTQQEEYDRLNDAAEYQQPTDNFLYASLLAPFYLGEPAVDLIVGAKGLGELNGLMGDEGVESSEILLDPFGDSIEPATSEEDLVQMINFEGEQPDFFASDRLGPVVWFQILAPHLGIEQTLAAVLGYDNDLYLAAQGRDCVPYVVSFDTEVDAVEFHEAVVRAGLQDPRREDQRVTGTQCETLGDPSDQRVATIEPMRWYSRLVAHHHVGRGIPLAPARCAALQQIVDMDLLQVEEDLDYEETVADSDGYPETCTGG